MADVKKKNVQTPCASEQLNYLGSILNLDTGSLIKKVYSDAFLDKNSMVASHVTNMVMETVKKDIARNARNATHSVSIPQVLTSEEKDAFAKMYPEYNIHFGNNTLESHNFAHASRIVETLMCMNKLGYFVNCKIRDKKILIKDIGGNRVFHGLRGHISVHVCAPGLGMVDAGRRATADWRLETAVVDPNNYYKKTSVALMKRVGSHYCNNKAQYCSVQAPAAIMIHSIYDMTLVEVADALSRAKTTMATGTFIYDPRILMYTSGTLPLLNVMWKKYRRNGTDLIDFTFINDAQPVYTHSFRNYLTFLETTYISDTARENHYLFQFNENRNGIQFFTIIRLDQCYIPKSTIKINHSLFVKRDFLMVTYYEWVERICLSRRSRMRKIKLLVPTILWEQAYDMLKQQADGSFTVAKAQEFVICYNKKTIVNGQTVSHHQKCASNVLDKIAYALYIRVYIDKYLATSALTAVLDDVTRVRELTKAGPIKALYCMIKEKLINMVFPSLDSNDMIAPYCAWAALSKLYRYPVDVIDAVIVKPVEQQIPEILQLYRRNMDFGEIENELTGAEIVDVEPVEVVDEKPTATDPDQPALYVNHIFDGPLGLMPVVCNRGVGKIHPVRGDGHCFFHSVAFLAGHHGLPVMTPSEMRNAVVESLNLTPDMFAKQLTPALSTDFITQLVGGDGAEPVCALVCKLVAIQYGFNLCIHFHENDILTGTEKYLFSSDQMTYHFHFNRMTGASVGHFQPMTYDDDASDIIQSAGDELVEYRTKYTTQIERLAEAVAQYSDEEYCSARIRCNPPDPEHHGYVARTALKILPILVDYNIDINGQNVVDLCSAPGSLSQLMIERGANRVVAVTLPENLGGTPQRYMNDRVCQSYLDLCDLEDAAKYVKGLGLLQYYLVVADGAMTDGLEQSYERNRTLILSEIFCALSLLRTGGNFIMKSWWFKYTEQIYVLNMLKDMFVKVMCRRHYPIRVGSTEFYYVCLNYKGLDAGEGSVLQQLGAMILGQYVHVSGEDKAADDVNYLVAAGLDTLLTCVENVGMNYSAKDSAKAYTEKYSVKIDSEYESTADEWDNAREDCDNKSKVTTGRATGKNNKNGAGGCNATKLTAAENQKSSKYVVTNRMKRKPKSGQRGKHVWFGGADVMMGPIKTGAVSQILETALAHYDTKGKNYNMGHIVVDEVLSYLKGKCGKAKSGIMTALTFEKILQFCEVTYSKLTVKTAQMFMTEYHSKQLIKINNGYELNCAACRNVTYIPDIDGWYACCCADKTKLVCVTAGIAVTLNVMGFMVDGMMRDGITIVASMDRSVMIVEKSKFDRIVHQISDYQEHRRRLLISESETACTFMGAITAKVAHLFDVKPENVPSSTSVTQRERPVATHDMPMGEALTAYVRPITEPQLDVKDEIVDDGSQLTRLKKAFVECYRIWALTDHYHTVTLCDVLNVVSHAKLGRELNEYLDKQDGEPLIRSSGVWYPREPKGDYMYAHNGIEYEKFSMHGDHLVIVSEYTRKKFEPTFMRKCKPFLDDLMQQTLQVKFELVSGVPGCGKTTYIMKNHNPGDLVLSATKEGAVEFRDRAIAAGETDVRKNYKTVYSYLYNEYDQYDVVYVDEAMMMHPGMMYAICRATRCQRMVMVGDVKQIPYYVRIDYDATYHKFTSVFEVSSSLTTSYRCPVDVARYMRRYYDKFVSNSKILASLQVRYISGKNDVPSGCDVYLTFSQSDKDQLLTMFKNVHTIHEYQGKQAKRVCLYRGNPTPIKLYDSAEHHIVALTRHTHHLIYCTVVQDALYVSIQQTMTGGLSTNNSISYVPTSLFAANNYSICHCVSLDLKMSAGIAVDFKQRFSKYKMNGFGHGVGMVYYQYDSEHCRYVYNMVTKDKYYKKPTIKDMAKALTTMSLLMHDHGVKSIHMPAIGHGLDGLNWYDVEATIRAKIVIPVVVHDPKYGLDKYRLADVIMDYHRIQSGPTEVRITEVRDYELEPPARPLVDMPKAYVLVYCSVDELDLSLQKKFHRVPLTLYHERNTRVVGHRRYVYACVLTDKRDIKRYKIPRYYSEQLMHRSYACKDLDGAVDVLQQFNDSVLPNAYGIDTSLDVLLVANSDITCFLQNCAFDQSRVHNPIKQFDCVKPILRTAMCPPRPSSSLKEVMKAIEKRNCAVPRIQVTMDVYAKATELFKKTLKYVYNDVPKYDDISLNVDEISEWLTTQDSKIATIIEKQSISDMALNKYSLTIKKNSKPLLDMSCVNTYAALQTVVFSKKDFNTYFCPIFRIMKKNMVESMVSKVMMFSDVPPKKFSEFLRARLARYDMNNYYSLEFDVSKYDKSQALLHLLVDCMLMRHFGVTDLDVNRWFISHAFTQLHDPCTGFSASNYFQRKSGDPSTWILNTQQVLVMIINVLDMQQWESVLMIAVSGDDSEIISLDRLRVNQKRFADVFNYEVKVYDSYTSIYFCSKFMIIDSGNVYLIPDVYKMIKKLGRHDLKNREHLVSYRRSVLDGLKDFVVPTSVKDGYVRSLCERYKTTWFSYDTVIDALFNLSIVDDDFEKLYKKNENYYNTGYGGVGDI